jgi:nucleoid DNA-binding protein
MSKNTDPNSIDKKKLWLYVNKKINRIIHHYHVIAVISILFEEMIKDLKDGKKIKIANFGTFELKNMPARKYHDLWKKKTMLGKPTRLIKFTLFKKIIKKIREHIDIESSIIK